MYSQSLETAVSTGGRPRASINAPHRRSTASPFPVCAIPIALAISLFVVALWSWTIIRPRINAMLHSSHASASRLNGTSQDSSLRPGETNAVENTLSTTYTPQVLYWSSDILHWADEHHLDPNVVALVMQIESCGHPRARSHAGAMGLFQVMPFHFGSDENPYDPSTNARRGLAYLSRSLDLAGGRLDLALAGYNGGHRMIFEERSLWPAETQRYVNWGVRIFNEMSLDGAVSPTLQAWLNAGGEHLCKQASEIQSELASHTTEQSAD